MGSRQWSFNDIILEGMFEEFEVNKVWKSIAFEFLFFSDYMSFTILL